MEGLVGGRLIRPERHVGDDKRAAGGPGDRADQGDQLVDGLEPWGGVTAVWAAGSPLAEHAVDTTDTFEAGVASLRAHQAYIDGLGWADFDPAEFLEGIARATGTRLGTPMAAAFEVFPMGWGA